MVKLFEIFFLFVAQFFINAGIYILETLLEYCWFIKYIHAFVGKLLFHNSLLFLLSVGYSRL